SNSSSASFLFNSKIYMSRIGKVEMNNAAIAVGLLEEISQHIEKRISDGMDEDDTIKLQDFPQKYIQSINPILHNLNNPDYALQEVYRVLDSYEGFENVKKHFEDIKTKIDINKERKERGIPAKDKDNHHILFVGNPGTGKSTMLKLAAEFYTSLGVLSSNNPIYFDAKATANIESDGISSFEKALKEANRTGRLLCIDEGNLFVETASGGLLMHDFVQAAQDKEHYPHLIVAMCIYPRNYKRFMNLDDGMERRFEVIELPNYTGEELYHMFEKIVEEDHLEIADEAQDGILNIFGTLVNVGAGEMRNASLPQTVFEELNIIRFRRHGHDSQKYMFILDDINVFNETKLNRLLKGDVS
ncbi:MAG: hypothetical protein LUH02_04405, partial [Erysipelotrichaceae bacterium]|nr:hypothetical protein [Erysipelotrichaceae bacterium]